MTLLNNNLFSAENFGSVATSRNQSGNNSHGNFEYNAKYSVNTHKNSAANKGNGSQSLHNQTNNRFDREMEQASTGATQQQRVSSQQAESSKSESATEPDRAENSLKDKTQVRGNSPAENPKEVQNFQSKLQKVKDAIKAAEANDGTGLKAVLESVLSPEEMSKLADLGFSTESDFRQLLLGGIAEGESGRNMTKDGGSGLSILDGNPQKSHKALSLISKATPGIAEKLAELSGLSTSQVDELLSSIVIDKQSNLSKIQAEVNGTPKGTTLKELLSMAESQNIRHGKSTKSDAKVSANGNYSLEELETDGGEKIQLSANMSQSFGSGNTGEQAGEKLFSEMKNIGEMLSAGNKSSTAKSTNPAQNLKNQTVFRNIRLENIANTTAKITSQMNSGDTTTARMHLNPRSLGTVFVEIQMAGNLADIKFRTESAEAAKTIEGQISQLKDQLHKEGIKAGNIEYTQDEHNSQQANDHGRDANPNTREERESRKEYIGYTDDSIPEQLGFGEELTLENQTMNNSMTGRS